MNVVSMPIRLRGGSNAREHHMVRSRRVKAERWAVQVHLATGHRLQITEPIICRLTKIGPGTRPMDDDNLRSCLKAIRDQFSAWHGVDDGREDLIRFRYAQERGPYGCRIEWAHARDWPAEVAP